MTLELRTCMEYPKRMKSICIIGLLAFITLFAGVFWMLQLQRDMKLRNYYTVSDNRTFISTVLHSNITPPNSTLLHYPHSADLHHDHPQTNNTHVISTDASPEIHDPYSDIFYFNTHLTNTPKSKEAIDQVHNMWWNYELFPMQPFTECEERYLGYKQNAPGRPGDLTFANRNSFTILCANTDEKDVRHSHIECYNTRFKGSSQICSFKNIYAYIDNDNKLKFTSFCDGIRNKNMFQSIQKTYKSSGNNGFPLYIDIRDDSQKGWMKTVDDAKYLDMNNIWFYDNDRQCESHKKGDARHIGNPWHCFGHLEYWYRISKAKNISTYNHNMTLVMSQFSDHIFGPSVPIYHFYAPLFGNVINADTIKKAVQQNGDREKGKLYYIKELFIDERSSKGWGAATIWQEPPQKNFFRDGACKGVTEHRRSHTYYDLRKDMMNYYELNDEYAAYDWVKEIKGIQNMDAWDIYGDLDGIANRNQSNGARKLVVVATRFVQNQCRYRCIANMREVRDGVIHLLGDDYVIVYGNPGTLTFHAQYHLFKNTRVFIGVHGAVFLMASLFMPPENLKFELTMKNKGQKGSGPNSEMVVRLFGGDGKVAYGSFNCGVCNPKKGITPSHVNVANVITTLNQTFHYLYNS